ncbi:MAG: AMP-binding protein, partial [Rhizobacter sp.]|nr:AMP-binding protein [Rhizobacter sp.]
MAPALLARTDASPTPVRAGGPPALANWIDCSAARQPDKIAVRFGDTALGYVALAQRCDTIAAALAAAGVRRGDRVAWLGLNCPAMLATLFACARLGAIFMPLNWRLAPPEQREMLHACGPAVLCIDDGFAAASRAGDIAPAGTLCVVQSNAPAGWTRWDSFIEG